MASPLKLSPHFDLDELTKSQTALRLGIYNQPNPEALQYLTDLCNYILEPVRDRFGAFSPSSAYRSPDLCKAIGSKPTSQHAMGQAADFEIVGVDNLTLAKWLHYNQQFDQLILEYYTDGKTNSGWVHCSYVSPALSNRKDVLRYDGVSFQKGLE